MKSIILSAFISGALFSLNVAAETGEECADRINGAIGETFTYFDGEGGVLESVNVSHGKGGRCRFPPFSRITVTMQSPM